MTLQCFLCSSDFPPPSSCSSSPHPLILCCDSTQILCLKCLSTYTPYPIITNSISFPHIPSLKTIQCNTCFQKIDFRQLEEKICSIQRKKEFYETKSTEREDTRFEGKRRREFRNETQSKN